jgi:hypothetical protein
MGSPMRDQVPPYQHRTGLHIDNKNVHFRHDFTIKTLQGIEITQLVSDRF